MPTQQQREFAREVKEKLFAEIRDTIMEDRRANAPELVKEFTERHIAKLDYNEKDRVHGLATMRGSQGAMRLPERCKIKGGFFKGFLFRNFRLTTADEASVGAVAEAFANDLARIAGIPSQDLTICKGKYSDGHTKLMLEAKFADGYKDFDGNNLEDGRIVPGQNDPAPESLGKYKAFFLLLADRDAIGSHGQNKGLRNGRFFAIDPGHSLEGNGRYLDIKDNFSFRDTKRVTAEKRFKNFSVFDDDTRMAKLSGVLALRNLFDSGRIDDLYGQYIAQFDRNTVESREDKELYKQITERLTAMKAELDAQMEKINSVFASQINLYDSVLDSHGAAVAEKAVEAIENLEKLTSPVTSVSRHGTVNLTHLEVIPESRIPWSASIGADGTVTYTSAKPIGPDRMAALEALLQDKDGITVATGADGTVSVTIDPALLDASLDIISEENVRPLALVKNPEA